MGRKALLVIWMLGMAASPAEALDLPPLMVGGGAGIATLYLNPVEGQTNLPLLQLQAEGGARYLHLLARVGGSIGKGEKRLARGLLRTEADYFYSLMLKPRIPLFDPANTAYLLGGWSRFRLRSTLEPTITLSTRVGFGYGIGLSRDLGKPFSISLEYMRYTSDLRAATLNLSYVFP